MGPRSISLAAQLSPEISRLLQKSDLNVEELQKVQNYLRVNPQHLIHHSSRLEVLITKVINPVECNCPAKDSTHLSVLCDRESKDEKIQLAAACFSLMPFLKFSPQRLHDYQLRLARCLCETLCGLLEINRLPHATLSTVQAYLNSKVDCFLCITPVDKMQKFPNDFADLLYMRADFFIYCLRSIFLRDSMAHINICLPTFMSIFNSFFEVNLTDNENIPGRLLVSSSRLMLCLNTVCETLGTLVMPAVPCLLTIITYHLEWTVDWRLDARHMEYFVRLRLAAISCLLRLVAKNMKFSYSYFMEVMPRIVSQLVHDLQCVSSVYQSMYSVKSGSMAPVGDVLKSSGVNFGLFEKRVTLAVLLLVEYIFKDPGILRYAALCETKSMMNIDCVTSNGLPVNRASICNEFSRLFLSISNIISHINAVLSRGIPCFQRQDKITNMVTVSPPVLIAFAKTSVSCAISIHNQTFRLTVLKFLNNLIRHPDNAISLTAMEYFHRLSSLNLDKPVSHENSELNSDNHLHDTFVHQPKLVLQKEYTNVCVEHDSEVHSCINNNSISPQDELPFKRPRVTETQTVNQTKTKSPDTKHVEAEFEVSPFEIHKLDQMSDDQTSTRSSDVSSLLTAFDPTFV
ncbi:unnamed protein product [Heterobilharzia americana]|nr:unnamed protein product [Heterobilharzia americana]CAH8498743.1 unnamed protein product [Heterobilharzia americana]